MSKIGDVYGRYREALDWSLEDFQKERDRCSEAMKDFYPKLFQTLVRDMGWIRSREGGDWQRTLRVLKEQFGREDEPLLFAAIDGTSGKEQLSEMLVFYGASYAQGGSLHVTDDVKELRYSRWAPSEDTSVVAYLPIPLNRLELYEDAEWMFRSDDMDRSAAMMIHNTLMQLAEIDLAYRKITSEDRPINILLLDHSLSSTLLSTDVMHLVHPYRYDSRTLGWIGAHIGRWGRTFEPADALVAHAHPMNVELQVPSWRFNALAEAVVANLTDFWQVGARDARYGGGALRLSDVFEGLGITSDPRLQTHIKERLRNLGTDHARGLNAFELRDDAIYSINHLANGESKTLRERWNDLRQLFEYTCGQLFREESTDALQLTYPSNSDRQGPKWMDNNDIRFLIGLGLRLIIELCWQKRILLLGVVKDSASCYLTRNFLGVAKATQLFDVPSTPEPPGSDRLTCELVPYIDGTLQPPWATVEFDAIFMTLRALKDDDGNTLVRGVRGDVLTPTDGLFLRSLMTLFLQRRPEKLNPLMGHTLFLDRIAYPYFDSRSRSTRSIHTRDSSVRPLLFSSNQTENIGQDVAMLVADLLTRNCFPEAIGQPDPLHRADLGAKALGNKINRLVRQSVGRIKTTPLTVSFRDHRDG